ncbi:hypothetical protein Gasu2_38680 [Galdieria sulphuraria]|nr:hypothetical protein Gasu2_38680 [Galdieria sulphuraria]
MTSPTTRCIGFVPMTICCFQRCDIKINASSTNAKQRMRLGHKIPDAHNVSTFPLKDKQQLLSTETPKIQGEWIGYSATYEIDSGKVVHVPEKWVPDAFIDWGVIVNGLEHMTSAVLDGDLLRIKETLILPKVGCEEDSVAVDISEYQIPYKSVAFVPFPGGSFSYGPTSLQGDGSRLDILTHMAFSHSTESERWTRLGVTVSFETKRIHLVKEEWNSEYNGGQSLIGCGGNIEAFDDDQRTWGWKCNKIPTAQCLGQLIEYYLIGICLRMPMFVVSMEKMIAFVYKQDGWQLHLSTF